MAVLRPKKTAPFNQTAKRTLHKDDTKANIPGKPKSAASLSLPQVQPRTSVGGPALASIMKSSDSSLLKSLLAPRFRSAHCD